MRTMINEKEKKTFAFLDFLKKLAHGDIIKSKEYAIEIGVSTRTVERWVMDIEEFFGQGVLVRPKRGEYTALMPHVLDKVLLPSLQDRMELERLIDLIHIVHPGFTDLLPEKEKKIVKKLERDLAQVYHIKESPFEDFDEFEHLEILKKSIKGRRYCDIDYKALGEEQFIDARPMRIVFAEGNWYLAVTGDGPEYIRGFLFLRIAFITQITQKSKTFNRDLKAEEFIERFQTLFSAYDSPYFQAYVAVSPNIERFFRQKKFLKSQQIIERLENGWLRVRYEISEPREILLLAKRWMPDMIILEPQSLVESFEKILQAHQRNRESFGNK